MTTLNGVAKKKTEPCAEELVARELVRLAKEQGLSLTGPDGLLEQFTKNVLEKALNEELTEGPGAGLAEACSACSPSTVTNAFTRSPTASILAR